MNNRFVQPQSNFPRLTQPPGRFASPMYAPRQTRGVPNLYARPQTTTTRYPGPRAEVQPKSRFPPSYTVTSNSLASTPRPRTDPPTMSIATPSRSTGYPPKSPFSAPFMRMERAPQVSSPQLDTTSPFLNNFILEQQQYEAAAPVYGEFEPWYGEQTVALPPTSNVGAAIPATATSSAAGGGSSGPNIKVVRFEVKGNTKEESRQPMPTTIMKRKGMDSNSLRVLTGTIERIQRWFKIKDCCPLLFEVIAPLELIRRGMSQYEKHLTLRDPGGPALLCVFYEMDRPMPPLQNGQLVRCVGRMVAKTKMHAFSVRLASAVEQASLKRLTFISHRIYQDLAISIREQ